MAKRVLLQQRSIGEIAQQITAYSELSLSETRSQWREAFGRQPSPGLTQDLLVRQMAWRLQEEAFGGHDRETLRLLNAMAGRDGGKTPLYRRLKSGTSVAREYQGVRHVVVISEGGFVWQGKSYASLSKIAREITGARWNGPRFFGLRTKDSDLAGGCVR